jgi:hypothetical protein
MDISITYAYHAINPNTAQTKNFHDITNLILDRSYLMFYDSQEVQNIIPYSNVISITIIQDQ